MANLSYVRFQNTLKDLLDCAEHIGDELKSDEEIKARRQLIYTCYEIVYPFLDDVGYLDEPMVDELGENNGRKQ